MAIYIPEEELKRKVMQARAQGYDESAISRLSNAYTTNKPKENIVTRNLPAIGSVLGGVAGGLLGGVGAIGGSSAGGALGEVIRQRIAGERSDTGKVLSEGALGLVGGVGGEVVSRVGAKALGRVATKAAESAAGKEAGGIMGWLKGKAANAVLQPTPSVTTKAAKAGFDIQGLANKWLPKLGTDYDALLGRVADKGKTGTIKVAMQDAEKVIQDTVKVAGNNVRISGEEVLAALKAEAAQLKGTLGSETKQKALDNIIKQAEAKYKNGITVKQALAAKRTADKAFGAAVSESSTKEAVATAAQKLEANTLRATLRKMFPEIAGALDDEAELLTLKPILEAARGKAASGKLTFGKLDITRPGSFVDAVLNSPKVAGKVLSTGSTAGTPVTSLALSKLSGTTGRVTGNVVGRILGGSGDVAHQDTTTSSEGQGNYLDGVLGGAAAQGSNVPATTTEPKLTQDDIVKLMINDLAVTGGKNLAELNTLSGAIKLAAPAQKKKTEAQIAREDVGRQIDNAVQTLSSGGVITGKLNAPIQALAGTLGIANQKTLTFNTQLSSIKGAITKARAGASLTPNEEKLINQYTPKVGDSMQIIRTKLSALQQLFPPIDSNIEVVPSGIQTNNTTD